MQPMRNIRDLDFVTVEDDRVVMWNPGPTAGYTADTQKGREFADKALHLMTVDENPNILNDIIRDMVKRGEYGGFEVGFVSRIAGAALV